MAVVDDRDKTHSQDRILDTSIPMNNDYTRDLINKVMAAEAVEAENQRRHRYHVPLPTPALAVRHVNYQQQRLDAEKIGGGEEDQELSLELSLGLSSNGRFGFDPNAKKIKRTASIPESSIIPVSGSGGGNLIRTCSLPVESREEWLRRKEEWLRRKELQSQRRMEARRRKNEKRRQSRTARERERYSSSRERGAGTEDGGENSNNNNPVEQQGASADGLIRTTSLVRRVGGIVLNNGKEIDQVVPISSPPLGGSIGGSGSSSGTSESDVQKHGQGITPMKTENSNSDSTVGPQNIKAVNFFEGSNSSKIVGPQDKTKAVNFLEGLSSSKILGPQDKTKAVNFLEGSSSTKIVGPQNKKVINWLEGPQNKTEAGRNRLDDMPSVTTKGNGPNGKRIEGFLYKYGRGKEVRIVCVCHGSFLTPAEFVKHAGGGDVPNPLQQIVVNSSSS
ncbi:unnamed protein product [Lathyrus sativus]|nr:unnamed protein product [Lathyrus sativus]